VQKTAFENALRLIQTSDLNARFQIRLVRFIRIEKFLYFHKCTSFITNLEV
jgi:hypothetical protein